MDSFNNHNANQEPGVLFWNNGRRSSNNEVRLPKWQNLKGV